MKKRTRKIVYKISFITIILINILLLFFVLIRIRDLPSILFFIFLLMALDIVAFNIFANSLREGNNFL